MICFFIMSVVVIKLTNFAAESCRPRCITVPSPYWHPDIEPSKRFLGGDPCRLGKWQEHPAAEF
jgi:hypothetical protein